MELALGCRGEAPRDQGSGEAGRAAHGKERSGSHDLMERVVVRANAVKAFKRVRRKQGTPGSAGGPAAEAGADGARPTGRAEGQRSGPEAGRLGPGGTQRALQASS